MSDPAERLLEMLHGSWMTQALVAAAELGVADHLAGGPRTVDELAAACGAHAPALGRLLRALVALEVCTEEDDGRFALSPAGALLRAGAPDSLRAWTLWWGRGLGPAWGALRQSVETGTSARSLLHGTAGFDHLQDDPAAALAFHRMAAEGTRRVAPALVAALDFSGVRSIVDVGGGHGELIAHVLSARPEARGIVLDLPHAMDGGRRHLDAKWPQVATRCEFVAGDFFESVPQGADVYLLKNVLHDWDDAHASRLLAACRAAMTPQARLLVLERPLPERRTATSRDRELSRHDLTMLVACGSRERTLAEYGALLEAAGLGVRRVVAVGELESVLEAAVSHPASEAP